MKLEQVMPAYRAGLPICRHKWPPKDYLLCMLVRKNGKRGFQHSAASGVRFEERHRRVLAGLHADDWEVWCNERRRG